MTHQPRSAARRGAGQFAPYTPPPNVETVPAEGLTNDTPRGALAAAQIELLPKASRDANGDVIVFAAGDQTLLRKRCVSVIGTRDVSLEGAARARRLARELVAHDVVVVSGLAHGVDTEAMTSAIASGGHTIGVIGTPIDQAYPAKNRQLQEQVYREHLLISQFRSGSQVHRSNFPTRNRLMAMISDATVVIEASDTSGTLHQAAECMRLGRWLFIAKSVTEDVELTWPKKFLMHEKCRVLDSTASLMRTVYGTA